MKVFLFVIAVLSLVIISGCGSSQISSNTKSETTVVPVDITEFITEFVSNKTAAQDKYRDKYVQLTGFVSDRGVDSGYKEASGGEFIGAFVTIGANQAASSRNVQCFLDDEPHSIASAAAVRGGDKITVKGEVEDIQNTSVQLKNCSFVETPW